MGELNIYQRLSEVMKAVEYVQKDTKIQQKYTALTHDKLTGVLRQHFIEFGIIVSPSLVRSNVADTGTKTKNGIPIIRYEATYNVSFINIEKPEDRLVVVIESHANDEGDKAPGKSISYATKYAMLKTLSIESGDKEEERIEAHAPAFTHGQKQLFDVAIAEGDSFSMVALMCLLDEEAQTGLFNSFQAGAKSSGKDQVRQLQKEGLERWDNSVADLEAMIADGDGMGLKEAVDELKGHEKIYLAKRLGDKAAQDMGKLIKEIAV